MLDGTNSQDYFWDPMPDINSNQLYPDGYDTLAYTQATPGKGKKEVVVPQSYHLGLSNTPTTSKDEDRQWIDSQNPEGYTIEISQDKKASQVANTLSKTPKTERSAEVRSQNGTYLGVYGSFSSKEAAEQQLNGLPEDIKNQAHIKNWQAIQRDIN